ncbi:pseudouridine synthase [Mycoplasma nasistruthionis]|uniref:rRNA pseudouridine synthase n=1 Tax=Mycoplasma nasistruthionis TaxID=353852 RepID=A0A4Y6I6L9_9MOLU|nr:pseudouridine synthase [Mycoplasma nasistruthionis]QDF64950.1 rRNA pseudouridine synthase [Mycoplasma nasistruthionis]
MKKIRIEKFLAEKLCISRSEVKKLIAKKQIRVNENIIKSPVLITIDDIVYYNNQRLEFLNQPEVYLLNKPQGYVCANYDSVNQTVFDLVKEINPKTFHTIGRLDKDTTGLLLLTNNGELTHNFLAPKKHINKTYFVKLDKEIKSELIEIFKNGFTDSNGISYKHLLN